MVGDSPRRCIMWKNVISNCRRKLPTWRGRYLSLGGRAVLINSVLNTIPVHALSFYKISSEVLKEIRKIQSRLIWKGNDSFRSIHWIFMARPFELVKNINDTKELWKLVVHIHHKWTVVNKNKEHFELVVVDKDGCDIHVKVPHPFKQAYDSLLTVDNTYTISNFQVSLNDLLFKPSDHKFMLTFTGGTSVTDKNKHDIPAKPLKFTSFTDIMTGNWKKDVLIDVIGMVTEIGYTQVQQGGKKQQINLLLKDLSDNILNCTLWEGYAVQFHDFSKNRKDTTPIIIVLQYAKVKEEGKYPLSVSNTFNVTKLHVNDDLPQIKDFIGSQALSLQSQTMSQYSNSSQHSLYDKLMYKATVHPLADIVKLKELAQCVTVATITKLKAAQGGWYYQACHECPRVAKGMLPPYECPLGHKTETAIYRYKILIEVFNAGTKATFVIWDREAFQLLKVTAAQMRTNLIEAGITDPLEFPAALDTLVGMTMVFKVKWQPDWDNGSVMSILEDDIVKRDILRSFGQELPDSQIITTPNLTQNNESVAEASHLDDWDIIPETDITSNTLSEPLTPTSATKRIAPHESQDITPLSQTSEGQQSSTKMKKHIKLEN
ncbi:uncharacterized protein LOC131619576 [Vicia villosa]|uniref:uncharacterized protein LOC131619576 n=1 Tax=Vicia villosa TaxID=3911 RepID=UPI00273A903D|nr:uncharacterized protein LOC131619576 [Vicia villosa]